MLSLANNCGHSMTAMPIKAVITVQTMSAMTMYAVSSGAKAVEF